MGAARRRQAAGQTAFILATSGSSSKARRYRDICVPLGFGDELRAALMSGGSCWGFMCLAPRFSGLNFSKDEANSSSALAPQSGARPAAPHCCSIRPGCRRFRGPGFLMLAEDSRSRRRRRPRLLAVPKLRLAGAAASCRRSSTPRSRGWRCLRAAHLALCRQRARVRTKAGQWLIVHASAYRARRGQANRDHLRAGAFRPKWRRVAGSLWADAARSRGGAARAARLSTAGISASLSISDFTVQQHLKSVFRQGRRRQPPRIVAQVSRALPAPGKAVAARALRA